MTYRQAKRNMVTGIDRELRRTNQDHKSIIRELFVLKNVEVKKQQQTKAEKDLGRRRRERERIFVVLPGRVVQNGPVRPNGG